MEHKHTVTLSNEKIIVERNKKQFHSALLQTALKRLWISVITRRIRLSAAKWFYHVSIGTQRKGLIHKTQPKKNSRYCPFNSCFLLSIFSFHSVVSRLSASFFFFLSSCTFAAILVSHVSIGTQRKGLIQKTRHPNKTRADVPLNLVSFFLSSHSILSSLASLLLSLFFLSFLYFCFNSSLSNLSVSFSLSSSLFFSLLIVVSHVAIFTYFLLYFSLKIYSSSPLCYFSLCYLFLFFSCQFSLSIFFSLSSHYFFLSLFSAFLPKIMFNLLTRNVFRGLYLYLLWFCMFSLSALRK